MRKRKDRMDAVYDFKDDDSQQEFLEASNLVPFIDDDKDNGSCTSTISGSDETEESAESSEADDEDLEVQDEQGKSLDLGQHYMVRRSDGQWCK